MSETRRVWWKGYQHTFHPNVRSPHRGYVYSNGRRVYGSIELTGLGWTFTSLADTRRNLAGANELATASV